MTTDNASSVTERIRSVLARIRDPNPFDHPDNRRKWVAAGEVSGGTVTRILVTTWLDGPRRSHALHEGHSLHTATERPTENTEESER